MKNDSTTPVTDDDELAKVLSGMNGDGAALPTPTNDQTNNLQFEETTGGIESSSTDSPAAPAATEEPVVAPVPEPQFEVPSIDQPAPVTSGGLEDIKKDALAELRPLVDKLDLPADEKFDTLLLIIRSTDDQSLVNAAYDAAKLIEDEAKRAGALLDVIKEIDFFANQGK